MSLFPGYRYWINVATGFTHQVQNGAKRPDQEEDKTNISQLK
jgi:hypothetical protein